MRVSLPLFPGDARNSSIYLGLACMMQQELLVERSELQLADQHTYAAATPCASLAPRIAFHVCL